MKEEKGTQVTLDDIANAAMDDADFWKELRAGSHAALKRRRWTLAPDEARRLDEVLALHGKNIVLDVEHILNEARRRRRTNLGGGLFWMGIWTDKWFPPGGPTSD